MTDMRRSQESHGRYAAGLEQRAKFSPDVDVSPPADQWRWHTGSEINPPSTLTVWRDTNPEVGRIHLPDGRVKVIYQRPERHIGFRPGGA